MNGYFLQFTVASQIYEGNVYYKIQPVLQAKKYHFLLALRIKFHMILQFYREGTLEAMLI